MQQALRRDVGPIDPQPLIIRVIYSSWFYLSIASGLGAFVAWALLEPFFDDRALSGQRMPEASVLIVAILLFPVVAAAIGLSLGAAEGIMCRNPSRAIVCGLVGMGIGFGGALVAMFPAGIVLHLFDAIGANFQGGRARNGMPTGMPLLCHMVGRACFWAIASIPAGLGQGVALREKKVILNGIGRRCFGRLCGRTSLRSHLFSLSGNVACHGQPRHRVHHHRPRSRPLRRTGRGLDEDRLAADAGRTTGGQAVRDVPRYHGPGQFAQGRSLPLQGRGHRTAARPDLQSRRTFRDRRLQQPRRDLRQRRSHQASTGSTTETRSCSARRCSNFS